MGFSEVTYFLMLRSPLAPFYDSCIDVLLNIGDTSLVSKSIYKKLLVAGDSPLANSLLALAASCLPRLCVSCEFVVLLNM